MLLYKLPKEAYSYVNNVKELFYAHGKSYTLCPCYTHNWGPLDAWDGISCGIMDSFRSSSVTLLLLQWSINIEGNIGF